MFGILHALNERISTLDDNIRLKRLFASDDERNSTLLIVSYPRSGTTWMRMIVHQLVARGGEYDEQDMELLPYLEQVLYVQRITSRAGGIDRVIGGVGQQRSLPLRVIPTHLRYSQVRRVGVRAIYVWRDGCDVLLSLFHFMNFDRFRLSFDEFVRAFAEGKLGFGSWFDHVTDALRYRADSRLLLMQYEELKGHWDESIEQIADFCGVQRPDRDDRELRRRCSIEYMKAHQERFNPLAARKNEFIREGATGNGVGKLSSTQQRVLSDALERVHRRTGLSRAVLMPSLPA